MCQFNPQRGDRLRRHYTWLDLPLFHPNHHVKLQQQDEAALMRALMTKSRSALVLEVERDGLSAMFGWFLLFLAVLLRWRWSKTLQCRLVSLTNIDLWVLNLHSTKVYVISPI
jgi:hypothetical protein